MGVRFIEGTYDGTKEGATVMIDSVTETAFGPIFDSWDDAEEFVQWLPNDARRYEPGDLITQMGIWERSRKPAET